VSEPQQGIFGIDLGTTYSVVAYIDETGRPAVTRNSNGDPSVVFFESETNAVVGKVAKESAGVYPDQVVALIKREMGNKDYARTFFGKEYNPSGISAIVLGALVKDAAEATQRTVREVVITVPAYFGLLEKDATKKAGEIAGLDVIGIVPEPVAAAMHYGVTGNADGTTFLVYDLGGGTFDISLITMNETAIEVLAVGGDHMLGGADWDKKLFDHILEQTIEQTGDDSIQDDEGVLQELRQLAENTKQALSKAESKTVIHRLAGAAVKIVVTRKQFEEMTADLLEETVRITRRTLDDAETRYPGVTGQVSELLLVGGSSWMPAVTQRLKEEFPWEPKLADPDLAVAKGAALYAAGQTARYVEPGAAGDRSGTETAAGPGGPTALVPGTVTAEALRTMADRTGLDEERIEELAKRTVVNVLPKAVGVKLVDGSKPNWQDDPESAYYVEHLVAAQTPLPYQAEKLTAATMSAGQESIEIEIWEQSGAITDPGMSANHRVDNAGLIEGLASYSLPAGSPIDITMGVDAEGTVSLVAVERQSGKELKMSVKISIMPEEKVAEAKANFSGLVLTT